MKHWLVLLMAGFLLSGLGSAEDKKNYQLGTFVTANSVADGTLTSTITGDGTTVAGGVYENRVKIYTVRVPDGVWKLETDRQAVDATMRSMGMTPSHFKSEKPNPLDFLKDGERVLFRVEQHKKIGGTETDVFIPYADKPDKEVKFVGTFISNTPPPVVTFQKPTDNVKAMCDAHKLTPEQEKQLCTTQATVGEQTAAAATDKLVTDLKTNSEAAQTSPAAAAALIQDGHASTKEELEDAVKAGRAARCAVITSPVGAEVFIDGNKAGVSPFVFFLMKRDAPRTVTIKMPGYKTVEKQFDPDGTPIPIGITLEKEN